MSTSSRPTDPTQLAAWFDAHDIRWIRTEGTGVDGLVMGKIVTRRTFERSLPLGNALTEIAFGFDLGGTPYLSFWPAWRNDTLGDIHQRPDLSTMVISPDADGVAHVLCDHVDTAGTPLPVCPRGVLSRVCERLAAAGYRAIASFELEGMLFGESYDVARRRGYRGLTPIGVDVGLGYLQWNLRQQRRFWDEAQRRLEVLGLDVEGYHDEAAPGQFELNFEPADPVTAADKIMRARHCLKETAHDLGWSVSFAAKPVDSYGNGLHVHHSLRRGDVPVFDDEAIRGAWIAGLIATMPAATSILLPNINSFRRLVGWAAAPQTATWAEDNKTTALRTLVHGSPAAARVEHRLAGGDANPYLVLAAVLAGGLTGLRAGTAPPPAFPYAGWGLPKGDFPHLPGTISQAADALAGDAALGEELGADFVDFWVESRRWEWLMFHTGGGDAEATTVTDWELRRYWELV